MGLVDRIAASLRSIVRGREPGGGGEGIPPMARGDTHLTDYTKNLQDFRGTPVGRADAAEASITAMRCINFRAGHIRNLHWQIERLDESGNWVPHKENTRFHNMLFWHHHKYKKDFITHWLKMLLIHGNVYMEKLYLQNGNGGMTRMPGGLRVLNSAYVNPEIQDGELKYFNYFAPNVADGEWEVDASRILWDIIPSFHSDWRGKSPMDRALEAVNLDRYSIATVRSYLINDNKPSAVLTLDPSAPNFDPQELDEFVEQWKRQSQGPGGGYTTRVLPAPFNLHTFSTQKPDMQLSMQMATLICREYKLDPVLVGIIDESDGSTIQKTSQFEGKFIAALTDAILPDAHHLADFINAHILPFLYEPEFDGTFRFAWDLREIDRMIKYSETSVDQLRSDFLSGAMTKNEYREARFLPCLDPEAGDVFVVPKGYIHVPKEDMKKLALLNAIDDELLERAIELRQADCPPLAFRATASPNMLDVSAAGDEKPGENRYPVRDD